MNWGGAVIGVLVIVGVVSLVWYTIAKERAQALEREQRALERGWAYSRSGGLYSLQGSEGGASWTLVVHSSQKNRPAKGVWKADSPSLPGGVVAVGSKAMAFFLKNPLGNRLAQWGMRVSVSGEDVTRAWNRLVEGCEEVDTGDADFASRYAVLATDTAQARKLLSGEVIRAVLEWDGRHKLGRAFQGEVEILWSDAGLMVTWNGSPLLKPDDMAGFVELCLGIHGPLNRGW